jgi:hypothetical protein
MLMYANAVESRESHGMEQEAMAIMTFVFVPEKKA